MSYSTESKNRQGYAYKCSGIPMLPDESLYEEMRAKLNDDELEQYKKKVEKYYGDLKIKFPWNGE